MERAIKKIIPLRPPLVQNPKYYLPKNTTTTTNNPQPPIVEKPPIINDDAPIPEPTTQIPNSHTNTLIIEPIPIPILQRQESVNVFPIFVSGMTLATILLGIPFLLSFDNKKSH